MKGRVSFKYVHNDWCSIGEFGNHKILTGGKGLLSIFSNFFFLIEMSEMNKGGGGGQGEYGPVL